MMTFGIEEPLLDQLARPQNPLVFRVVGPDRPGIQLTREWTTITESGRVFSIWLRWDIGRCVCNRAAAASFERIRVWQRLSALVPEYGIASEQSGSYRAITPWKAGLPRRRETAVRAGLPTTVMCSNDMTAIGLLQKAYRAGLRVPDDLSIIGFDNIHITQMTIPPLTTIQMSCYDLAREAVMALRAHVEQTSSAEARPSYPNPVGCSRNHRISQRDHASSASKGRHTGI